MQTKDKSHIVSFGQFDLIYEDDVLSLHSPDDGSFEVLTPETVRQMKTIMDLFLIDQYQV